MKNVFTGIILAACLLVRENAPKQPSITSSPEPVKNLFIITIDGVRWQELFTGADSSIIGNDRYCPDTATMRMMYWASSPRERRKNCCLSFGM